MERSRDNRRSHDAGSRAFIGEHTAKDKYIIVYGISQRKKCDDDFRKARKLKIQVWEPKFLGNRILCEYGRNKYRNGAKVYPRTG